MTLTLTRLPFEAESTQLLYKKIRQGVPSLPSHILPAASSLLHGMLEVAPEKRLALAHVPTPCRAQSPSPSGRPVALFGRLAEAGRSPGPPGDLAPSARMHSERRLGRGLSPWRLPTQVATHEWLQLECEIPRLSAAVDAVVDFSASSLLSHPGLWMAAYRRPLRSLSAPCVRPRKAG